MNGGTLWTCFVGWLFGLERVDSFDQIRHASFSESWASGHAVWVFFGAVALAAVGIISYFRFEPAARGRSRWWLAALRGAWLALLLIVLAGPMLTVVYTKHPRPLLYLLFDGSDSMAIQDNLGEEQLRKQADAVALTLPTSKKDADLPRRMDYIQAMLRQDKDNVIKRLAEKYRLRAFVFDRPEGVRGLALGTEGDKEIDPAQLARELSAKGEVTALGSALEDLAVRHKKSYLAGVVVWSDFGQNSGPAPVGSDAAPVNKLGVPVYTVGVGPIGALDVSIRDLNVPPVMKKTEGDTISVTLEQSQLDGRTAMVRLKAVPIREGQERDGKAAGGKDPVVGEIRIGEQSVRLEGRFSVATFPFKPEQTGRFEVVATVDPLDGERVEENNKASREVNIRDEFLRLLYVTNEPSWEWRFIKEVFHRDKLVGMRGFRTYLRASDPDVRHGNELFLPSLDLPRREFFANDVIFLGDMPRIALSTKFCEELKEYVGNFGGGLVVLGGPILGPGQLNDTPLADLLPVQVEPGSTVRAKPFRLRLTQAAKSFNFMQLGANDQENAAAWDNLGPLNWYQPAVKKHPLATVLAEHPTDMLADGKTPQPIIAVRSYGKGEVIYLAMDETWRLRKRYGETYYRQFWAQLIRRLGLGHSVGSQKRFVVRTDKEKYRTDERVKLTIGAYDEEFKPLAHERLAEQKLRGQLIAPGRPGESPEPRPLSVSESRPGVYEAEVELFAAGEHRIVINDPITREEKEIRFQVADISAERQTAVRNVVLQQQIARESGGKSYELADVHRLPDELKVQELSETQTEHLQLWATPFAFLLIFAVGCGEWIGRKWVRLP